MPTLALDIGCGPKPKNHFNADEVYGLDIREDLPNKVFVADVIVDPIPFGDAFFDYVTAHDLIEHIPVVLYSPTQRYPFVELMNEIWRVLKPGGKFFSLTPAYPHAAAFFDPTHVNYITEETYGLGFCSEHPKARSAGFYGRFVVDAQVWFGPHLATQLTKLEC